METSGTEPVATVEPTFAQPPSQMVGAGRDARATRYVAALVVAALTGAALFGGGVAVGAQLKPRGAAKSEAAQSAGPEDSARTKQGKKQRSQQEATSAPVAPAAPGSLQP